MQKSNLLKAAVFFLAAVCGVIMLFGMRPGWYDRVVVHGTDGTADLTGFDFDRFYASLPAHAGDREHYAGKLLMPDEIDNHTPDTRGDALSSDYATVRTRILIPDGDYIIQGKTPEYASRIYVNGELKASFGRIDEEKGNIYHTDAYEIVVHPVNGVLEIVTHSAGVIRGDWTDYPITIGSADFMQRMLLIRKIQMFVVLGFYIACAMFFLGTFMYLPRVKANLWFALLILVNAFRVAVVDKTMFQFFPGWDYRFTYMAENGTKILAIVFYLLLIRALFPESVHKNFLKSVFAVNAAQAAALLVFPIRVTAGFIGFNMLFAVLVTLSSVLLAARHMKRFGAEQVISFGGQLLFAYFSIAEITAALFQFYPFPVDYLPFVADRSLYGMLFFTFAQMLALFLHNNRAAENERRLATEKETLENMHRMKTEVFGNVSHDMKTPLTVIAGDIQLAEKFIDESKPEAAKELLREARRETMQMADRVTDALAFVRSQGASKPMERVDFGAAINATLTVYEPFIRKKGNTITRDIAKLPDITGNADMLVSVLVNLLTNANNHTSGGVIHVRWAAEGDTYRLTVRDNGSGIPEALLPHVFERGVTDGTGTGFGLAIVKSVAELHGGDAAIESEPGKGTAVTLTLPAQKEDAP